MRVALPQRGKHKIFQMATKLIALNRSHAMVFSLSQYHCQEACKPVLTARRGSQVERTASSDLPGVVQIVREHDPKEVGGRLMEAAERTTTELAVVGWALDDSPRTATLFSA